MENASKALLIAGAVLIVILIIGVGMLIFNSSRGSFDEAVAQMSSQEKEMFNNQFEQYAGDRVSGSNVKALIEKVNANNVVNSGTAKEVEIGVVANLIEKSGSEYKFKGNKASTANYYSVTTSDTKTGNKDTDGLISSITIAPAV